MNAAISAGPGITAVEFAWIQNFIREHSGIELKDGKETLVVGRLDRRLRHYGLSSYQEYFDLLDSHDAPHESRMAVDLLTTNETYFFREPKHFEQLPDLLPEADRLAGRTVRVWSAASSSGEEAFTIALTLADRLGDAPWEVVGTDISTRVLETARDALYPIEAAERIPPHLLRAHCLKGKGDYEGFLTVEPWIRARVTFTHVNLTRPLPELGRFDVAFLRNVMIYFSNETKRQLLDRVAATIRPGGYLLVGHAESLSGLDSALEPVAPSVYRIPQS